MFKSIYFLIVTGVLFGTTANIADSEGSQTKGKSLSAEAHALVQAFEMLQTHPNDIAIQKEYLERFPQDIETFMQLFAPKDFSELYSGSYNYIFPMKDLADNLPEVAGDILVRLSKDAPGGCCDALGHLRNVTAEFAVGHTEVFIRIVKKCSSKEVSLLIRNLADAKNHSAYKEYPLIIQYLRKLGEGELAEQFEQAKLVRMKLKNH